jgi:DNA-directed RNA polymerase specialized sigma24 family protein
VCVLQGKLVLHDIQDTEAFAARIVNRSGLDLDHYGREDLLAYLVETAWELSEQWNPDRNHRTFSGWALVILRRRVSDWQRSKYRTKWQFADKTYERPAPQFATLDDRPDVPVEDEPMDADPCSAPALRRLLRERSSQPVRRDPAVGQRTHDQAA